MNVEHRDEIVSLQSHVYIYRYIPTCLREKGDLSFSFSNQHLTFPTSEHIRTYII